MDGIKILLNFILLDFKLCNFVFPLKGECDQYQGVKKFIMYIRRRSIDRSGDSELSARNI